MNCRNPNYPLNLNFALDYTRDSGLVGIYPWPSMIGAVQGTHKLYDVFQLQPIAAQPFGPLVNANAALVQQYFTQVTFPKLSKVQG